MTAQMNGRHAPQSTGGFGETGDSKKTPVSAPETADSSSSSKTSTTYRDHLPWWLIVVIEAPQRTLAYGLGLLDQPPGWAELSAYAKNNVRLEKAPALVRAGSMVWFWMVTVPAVVGARIREQVLSRFLRTVLTLLVVEMFLRFTPFGRGVAEVIRTVYAGLAWLLLP